ncbi:hypothetical protein LH462_06830 [Laribacter hongkongensis]|uniref:Uncharacterized protein n=1 Tax=Laribacter hongkongensis TaxID=168471 RepID=A0ABD4SN85_9NEIS|nr:hypothetical protein [Laribacter hongkongensis]MCG9025175.1 hypothetical protein [Laribacter hongkongensis]MCG9099763.1 hypothetical protein [Laribacter hongkongensis]MCG9103435.1 hypothetical protein [Laribacter hongkongensis]MCG9111241.1 hypothetical protein [Laribacter hongkongensis]MCG9118182.1 hypothetical protein [Laribacter hongkongensis]
MGSVFQSFAFEKAMVTLRRGRAGMVVVEIWGGDEMRARIEICTLPTVGEGRARPPVLVDLRSLPGREAAATEEQAAAKQVKP